MKTIESPLLGTLSQDEDCDVFWRSEEVSIPFLGGEKLPVVFLDLDPEQDTNFIAEADEALEHFFRLTEADKLRISHHVYKNCMDFLEEVEPEDGDEEMTELEEEEGIWEFVEPWEICVTRRRYKEEGIYVLIICGCDWEREHGLQLVFKEGKQLTRVSAMDDHVTDADAYAIPDEEDELLAAFR